MQIWKRFALEHSIDDTGCLEVSNDHHDVVFHEIDSTQLTSRVHARAILVCSEPLIEAIRTGNNDAGSLFANEDMIAIQDSSGETLDGISSTLKTQLEERLRLQLERADSLGGIIIYSGSTGSSTRVASHLLDHATDGNLSRKTMTVVNDIDVLDDSAVDDHSLVNHILFRQQISMQSSVNFAFCNSQMSRTIHNSTPGVNCDFKTLNHLQAIVVCQLTSGMRFQSGLFKSIGALEASHCPYPTINWLGSALHPLHRKSHPQSAAGRGCSLASSALYRDELSTYRVMAASLLVRGLHTDEYSSRHSIELINRSIEFVDWNPAGLSLSIDRSCHPPLEACPFALGDRPSLLVATSSSQGETAKSLHSSAEARLDHVATSRHLTKPRLEELGLPAARDWLLETAYNYDGLARAHQPPFDADELLVD